jgi:hypothetical protein
MEVDTLFGLPAHPLLLHVPVLGIPICAILALLYVLRPGWRPSLALPFGAFTALVLVFTVLTAGSGEPLEHKVDRTSQLHDHTELGEQLRTIVIVFGVVTLIGLILDWYARRQQPMERATNPHRGAAPLLRRAALAFAVAAVILGGVATVWDVRTGHSGAKAVWADDEEPGQSFSIPATRHLHSTTTSPEQEHLA